MNPYVIFIIVIASLGGVLYGFDVGIMAGTLLFVGKDIPMTHAQLALIAAAVLGGGSLVTLISGALSDYFGRLKMLATSAIVFLIGIVFTVLAHSYGVLLFGRMVQGLGIGIISIVCPLYLSEIMPVRIRGRGVNAFGIFITFGIMLSGLVGYYFTKQGGNWRAMLASALVPGALFLIGVWFLPDSPRWLISKNKLAKARDVLMRTRPPAEAASEIQAIQEMHRIDKGGAQVAYDFKELFDPKFTLPLLLVLAFGILNQLTGINSFLQYSALFLKTSGASSDVVSMIGSVWITVLNVVFAIIGFFLIDKIGRKPLLSFGTAGITLSLVAMSLVSTLLPNGHLKADLFLACLLLMISTYAIGPGTVIYLALSELLPTPIRSMGMAIALFLNGLTSTGLAAVMLPLADKIGYGGVFIGCAIFTSCYFLLAFFVMPETKNKSLEEIEKYFISRYRESS